MFRFHQRLLGLLAFLWLGACAAGAQNQVSPPPKGAETALTFGLFLRQVNARHPRLQSARLRLQGAESYARGVGTQPNPTLRLGDTAGNPLEEVNALTQVLEISGQPRLRQEMARSARNQRQEELRQQGRELTRSAALSYFELWGNQEKSKVAQARMRLLEELRGFSQRRLQVGEISRNQHLRIEIEASRARADLALLEGQTRAARASLEALLQGPAPALASGLEEGLPLAPPTELPLEDRATLAAAIEGAPDLHIARWEQEQLESRRQLAEKEMSPKLQLMAYRSRLYNQEGALSAQLTLTFPLWDYGEVGAEVSRLEAEKGAARKQQESARLALTSQFNQSWEKLQAYRERLASLREQARGAYHLVEMAQKGYDAGLITLLEVFDAQRSYREVLLDWIEAQVQLRLLETDIYCLCRDPEIAKEKP